MATIVFATLSALSLASIAAGRPWTTVLARRTTDPKHWTHPLFRETNTVLTLGWALMFGLSALIAAHAGGAAVAGMAVLSTALGAASPRIGRRYAIWRGGQSG